MRLSFQYHCSWHTLRVCNEVGLSLPWIIDQGHKGAPNSENLPVDRPKARNLQNYVDENRSIDCHHTAHSFRAIHEAYKRQKFGFRKIHDGSCGLSNVFPYAVAFRCVVHIPLSQALAVDERPIPTNTGAVHRPHRATRTPKGWKWQSPTPKFA